MDPRQPIVSPKQRWNTRRIVCRPRARLFFRAAVVLAVGCLLLLLDLVGDERSNRTLWAIFLVVAGLAAFAGGISLFFRFAETPREVTVRDYWDLGEPPVIHVGPKR